MVRNSFILRYTQGKKQVILLVFIIINKALVGMCGRYLWMNG